MACVAWDEAIFSTDCSHTKKKESIFIARFSCDAHLKLCFPLVSSFFLLLFIALGIRHEPTDNIAGFGALAALKRKRKKFSKSRNTSPVLEPSTPSKVEQSPNKKVKSISSAFQVRQSITNAPSTHFALDSLTLAYYLLSPKLVARKKICKHLVFFSCVCECISCVLDC